jgi:hypothetical protein
MDIKKIINKEKKEKKKTIFPRSSLNSSECWFCGVDNGRDIRITPNFEKPKIGWNCCKKGKCLIELNEAKKQHLKTPIQIKEIFKKYKLEEPFINGYDDIEKFGEKGCIFVKRSTGNLENNWYLNNCAMRCILDKKFYIVVSKGLITKTCLLKEYN